jgi:hypothetical protein
VVEVSYAPLLRARKTRAAARLLRSEAVALRLANRECRAVHRLTAGRLAHTRAQREAVRAALGDWPNWATALELHDVLVPVPGV